MSIPNFKFTLIFLCKHNYINYNYIKKGGAYNDNQQANEGGQEGPAHDAGRICKAFRDFFAAVSMTERELNNVSEQNIRAMVREYHVNEVWLRTGEGEKFATVLKRDDVAAFAKLTPDQWDFLKDKITEIAGEINKAAQ